MRVEEPSTACLMSRSRPFCNINPYLLFDRGSSQQTNIISGHQLLVPSVSRSSPTSDLTHMGLLKAASATTRSPCWRET